LWASAAPERKKHGRNRRVPLMAVLGTVGLGLIVLAAVGYHDLRQVRSQLSNARDTLQQSTNDPTLLRTPEGRARVRTQIDASVASLGSARNRARHSIPLSLVQVVPGLKTQRSGLLTLVDDASAAANGGRDLLVQIDSLVSRSQLRNGEVPIDGVRELNRDLVLAADRFRPLVRSTGGLWGPVGDARRRFDDLATASVRRLDRGAEAVRAATTFLGADGDRRYLIAVQNNAEMRDQGSVLQYVVVRLTGRRLVFERNGSVGDISLTMPAPTPLPPGTREVFGPIRPTQTWQSVNATADFPLSGRAMSDMYRQATGQGVDGVIAVDVVGLSALLRVVGPVLTPGQVDPVTAENVAQVLLHDQYDGLPANDDSSARRERLGEVTHGVINLITGGSFDAVALGRELGDAAQGGHLRLWSQAGDEEDVFVRTGLGGGPASSAPDRTFHMAVENGTATKLDYFVKPSVRQEVDLTPEGTAIVRTTITVDNQAPVGAAPSYQLGPDGVTQARPGDYVAWMLLWGPAGSTQQGSVEESGLRLSQHFVPVPAGQNRKLTFETVVPHAVRDGHLDLRLVPQPRAEPVDLQVNLRAPGWHVDGQSSWRGPWINTFSIRWGVSR